MLQNGHFEFRKIDGTVPLSLIIEWARVIGGLSKTAIACFRALDHNSPGRTGGRVRIRDLRFR